MVAAPRRARESGSNVLLRSRRALLAAMTWMDYRLPVVPYAPARPRLTAARVRIVFPNRPEMWMARQLAL